MNVCTEKKGGESAGYINSSTLNMLCSGDQKKTIVIPPGSRVELTNMVYLGSNTTIIADGATIVMTSKDKGILSNKPDAVNYHSLTNVKIREAPGRSRIKRRPVPSWHLIMAAMWLLIM